jgi:hypothetical protein
MKSLGFGVLSWDGDERRSRRYGAVALGTTDYRQQAVEKAKLDTRVLTHLWGRRVRLVARVLVARESGHAGDAFLGIRPTTPALGEEIEIGVGLLFTEPESDWAVGSIQFGLQPSDGRDELWLDPRVLYRLHDQTVEILYEETSDPDSPKPDLEFAEPGAISNGDGTFQASGNAYRTGVRILPALLPYDDGIWTFRPQADPGTGRRMDVAPPRPWQYN